jgi:hypothetical protein
MLMYAALRPIIIWACICPKFAASLFRRLYIGVVYRNGGIIFEFAANYM